MSAAEGPAGGPARPHPSPTPERATRTGALRTGLRRLVFGALAGTVVLIMLFAGVAVLGATGVLFDPHGYGVIFGFLLAAILTPVALALRLLHRSLRSRPPG